MLMQGTNWRLSTDFAAQFELKGQLQDVLLRCPTVTLIIPRCTSAWRSCLQHSMAPVPASPAVYAEHTIEDLNTQLAADESTTEMLTQVEPPVVVTPATELHSFSPLATANITPALREVTNTQTSVDHCQHFSQQQNMPGFSQQSVGRDVGFTQVLTSPIPSQLERAGKVSVVLESARRAFTVLDLLQAVRAALQDVKGSGAWVFDGLHKTSAAGIQPVVYETVFML